MWINSKHTYLPSPDKHCKLTLILISVSMTFTPQLSTNHSLTWKMPSKRSWSRRWQASFPSAVISLDYASKLRDRYDGTVFEDRVHELAEEVRKAGYNKQNVSTYVIIDTARAKEIHFFLANPKFKTKMLSKVVSMMCDGRILRTATRRSAVS